MTAQILQFRTIHSRPPAANEASTSAVTPLDFAGAVSKSGTHQPAGMRLRWRHLRTASGRAPISNAKASGEPQRPTTSRNVEIELIRQSIGHIVLKRKSKMSHEDKKNNGQTVRMEEMAETAYRKAFMERTKKAREDRGLTQVELAELLGIDQGKYKQYETRSLLPHSLVHRFCIACQVDEGWLFGKAISAGRKRARKAKKERAA